MGDGGPGRFEELLRELRAEHERLLRRQGAQAPLGGPPRLPGGGGGGEWCAPACKDPVVVQLPGALEASLRDAGAAHGRPSAAGRTVCPAPEAAEQRRSEATEASLESVQGPAAGPAGGRGLAAAGKAHVKSKRSTFFGEQIEQRHGLARLVTSSTFELTMAAAILLNTLCIAAEAQYNGMESGYDSGVEPRMTEPADKVWPGADRVFMGIEWFYGLLFTAELVLKLVAVPKKTLKEAWTVIDVLVVVFFWIESLSNDLPFPPTLIRLLRLVRVLRLVKTIRGFASLYLMLQSIKGSVSAVGWSMCVLLLGEMMLAVVLNLLMSRYWEDESFDLEDRQLLFSYFGTFTKSLLTMIEMLLGNWYTITRVLTGFNEVLMLFGICHQLVFGFAVIEVISGVFLNETFKVAALDDSIMLNEVRRAAKAEKIKLTEFFLRADEDGSGLVDQHELQKVLDNKKVEEWLSAMGLDLSDISKVFSILDKDGDGQLSCDELLQGCAMLKKPPRAIDLAAVQKTLEDVSARIAALT